MITTTLAVLGASLPRVEAGDKEWATAGKVMAGVGAGLLLAKAFEPQPVYTPPPVYVQPAPVVYQPAPVVLHQPAPVVLDQPVQQVIVPPQPTVVHTQPVVVHQPVVYQYAPAPVVYHPAPVVYAPPVCPPVRYYRAPRPVVGFHFSIGHHHQHQLRRHRH